MYKSNKKQIQGKLKSASKEAVTIGANEWRNAILRTLTGNRSGREYYVPGTHKKYTASAAGEAPASVTGGLRTSYEIVVKSDTEAIVTSGLKSGNYYLATMLEKGTKYMKPRPHFWISYDNNKDKIENAMKRVFRS
jgi:hypothetical protein